MALFQIIRKAGSVIVPAAIRTLKQQRALHSAAGSAVQSRCRAEIYKQTPRIFSTEAYSSLVPRKSKVEENLLQVLDSEIQCAVESEPGKEDLVPEGAIPFKIEDCPGEQIIILRRKYGNEDIKIESMMLEFDEQPEEGEDDNDEDGDKDEKSQVGLNVIITKGDGPSLEFQCSLFPDEVVIDAMRVKDPKGAKDDDSLAYDGPAFADLDENLQKSFHKYLEVRGISGSLSNFLMEYMINKDSKEYIRWLKNIKDFLKN